MKCNECQGNYVEKSGRFFLEDPYVGAISVKGNYYKCDKCGDTLLTPEISEAIELARGKLIQELLNERPLGDFLSAAEAAALLGISRQALNKNRRIRHGFIFRTEIGGFAVYLKQSVVLYKESGDGRFKLDTRKIREAVRSNEDLKAPYPAPLQPVYHHSN